MRAVGPCGEGFYLGKFSWFGIHSSVLCGLINTSYYVDAAPSYWENDVTSDLRQQSLTFWHRGLVSWKTVFPLTPGLGGTDGFG